VTGGPRGSIYTSDDSGATWVDRSVRSAPPESAITGSWKSIASSSDGSKLAAVVNGGNIHTSDNFGANWRSRNATGAYRSWFSIASSSNGEKLAAVASNWRVCTSNDYGATWTVHSANSGRATKWYSIASSDNGERLAAVAWEGGVYTAEKSGGTWTWTDHSAAGDAQSNPISGTKNWRSIASSDNGERLAAVVENGGVYTAEKSGGTWTWIDRSAAGGAGNPISGTKTLVFHRLFGRWE